MVSPEDCTVVTELMPTWRTLGAQRLRWQRGALENLGAYGVTTQTLRYWAQQLGIGYGVIALTAYLLLIAADGARPRPVDLVPVLGGVGALFMVERVVTVWRGGWRARLLALALLPELCFDDVPQRRLRQGHRRHLPRPAGRVEARHPFRRTRLHEGGLSMLLPESILHSATFVVLAAFVAINTVMYGALALGKLLPKVYVTDWVSPRNQRSETRSIHPEPTAADVSRHVDAAEELAPAA